MAVIQEKNKKKWTKDGRSWYYDVYYTNIYGHKKEKKSKYYKTKSEAKDAERDFLNQIDINKPGKRNLTFQDIHKLHYEFKKNNGIKSRTLASYDDKFHHLAPLKDIKLTDYTIQHFENWKKYINEKTVLNISTKNDIYKYIKTLLNYARDYHGYSFSHVYPKMKKFTDPKAIKKEMNFYTYEEFICFISNEKNIKFKCIFSMFYYCGLRRGELMAIQWKNIDFRNKTVYINKEIPPTCNNTNWHFEVPKTNASIRTLPIPDILINDLEVLYNENKGYKNFSHDWFVFGDMNPVTRSSMYTERDILTKLSNLKKIRLHDFRHSCASLLINNGASITLVSKFLGHSSVKETLDTYSHLFKTQLDSIVNVINNL